MTVLMSGFEPFNHDTRNPSEEVLKQLPDMLNGHSLIKVVLPVVYERAYEVLKPLIVDHQPDIIVLLGLAAGRQGVSVERIAINCMDGALADNHGTCHRHQAIIPNGPDGLFTTYPLDRLMPRAKEAKLPITLSNTAGTFVCNETMYRVLYETQKSTKKTYAGFIHLPYLDDQVNDEKTPSMNLETIKDTLLWILHELLDEYQNGGHND